MKFGTLRELDALGAKMIFYEKKKWLCDRLYFALFLAVYILVVLVLVFPIFAILMRRPRN